MTPASEFFPLSLWSLARLAAALRRFLLSPLAPDPTLPPAASCLASSETGRSTISLAPMRMSTRCKRLKGLMMDPRVLSKASKRSIFVEASNWSENARTFLDNCAKSGNLEACYILGMIEYYCYGNKDHGYDLMENAGIEGHIGAAYSAGIILLNRGRYLKRVYERYNYSPSEVADKTQEILVRGFTMCQIAAINNHCDAIRELGFCFSNGYGVPNKNITRGLEFECKANYLEDKRKLNSPVLPLLDEVHMFLIEWFDSNPKEKWRMCANPGCGRVERYSNDFHKCPLYEQFRYCSWGCQSRDYKLIYSRKYLRFQHTGLPIQTNATSPLAGRNFFPFLYEGETLFLGVYQRCDGYRVYECSDTDTSSSDDDGDDEDEDHDDDDYEDDDEEEEEDDDVEHKDDGDDGGEGDGGNLKNNEQVVVHPEKEEATNV